MKKYGLPKILLIILRIISLIIGLGAISYAIYAIHLALTQTRTSFIDVFIIPYLVVGISFSLLGLSIFANKFCKILSLVALFVSAGQTVLIIAFFIFIFRSFAIIFIMTFSGSLVIFAPLIFSIIPFTCFLCTKIDEKNQAKNTAVTP